MITDTSPGAHPGRVPDADALRGLAARIRLAALDMVAIQGFGYLGQALSSAELFAVLFGAVRRHDRDRFVLSPGHYAVVYYAAAAEVGLLPRAELARYGADGAVLEAISTERTPGLDLTCGSLGQGLSGAVGFALADRISGQRDRRVFALLSDGEMEEGQVWEAATFAAHQGLGDVVVLLDANGSQVDGPVSTITTLEPIAQKWSAFGWHVREVDGHDVVAVERAMGEALRDQRPSVVVARTDILGRLRCIPQGADGHFIKLDDRLRADIAAEVRAGVPHA